MKYFDLHRNVIVFMTLPPFLMFTAFYSGRVNLILNGRLVCPFLRLFIRQGSMRLVLGPGLGQRLTVKFVLTIVLMSHLWQF